MDEESKMKIRVIFALVLALLAVSGCVVAPIGGRGGGYYGGYGGGHERGVWRG